MSKLYWCFYKGNSLTWWPFCHEYKSSLFIIKNNSLSRLKNWLFLVFLKFIMYFLLKKTSVVINERTCYVSSLKRLFLGQAVPTYQVSVTSRVLTFDVWKQFCRTNLTVGRIKDQHSSITSSIVRWNIIF